MFHLSEGASLFRQHFELTQTLVLKTLATVFSAGSDTTTTGSKTKTLNGFVKASKCMKAQVKVITDWVSHMLVQDLWLIRMGECEGFRKLLSYLENGMSAMLLSLIKIAISYLQRHSNRSALADHTRC